MSVAYFPRGNNLLRAKLQTALQRPNFVSVLPSLRQGSTTSLDTNESIREQVVRLIALDGFTAYLAELATAIQSAGATTDEAYAQVTRAATATPPARPRRQRR